MADLEERSKRVLSPVLGHYTYLPLDRAEGSWLITKDGRRVLDLTCGIAVTPVGHCHPAVVKAVTEQASKLMHISSGVASYEANVALAELLATVMPAGIDTFVFQNSGAEAIEAAVKLARQVTGREGIIVFRGGFHGRTTGAATLTTSKAAYRRGYGALLPEVHVAPFPYALACPIKPAHDTETCTEHCLAEIDAMLEHEIPPDNVAAFLIEPVLGEGGYVPAPAAFLRSLRETASRIGALLIVDEIQTAFGRGGAWTVAERQGVVPDIVTLAKALGGGLPLGAVAAPRALHEKWPTGTHGSTFGGNPVCCASGLATMLVLQREHLIERAETVGRIVEEELAPLRRDERVREIRRIGAMIAVEFGDKAASKAATAGALDRDVLLITCGAHDQVVRFIPALNILEEDLRRGVRAFVEAAQGVRQATPV
ncbi:MAG: aminotransferase class III-fold pyridoxal phosphate-dependent enzyme [Chloroflexota bacterium]|nr:aminotransferase class III-fold pyridoxal phosphate-dependent enzyme [Chloroflexota bacterium]MDE3100865.1 aminotransferase class III-fold pyridoxal phosphate-dependent enzyme [Chloroflexota bacterium]